MFAGKDFLNMPAPAGYKAGVGRGATAFTTRADLEPLKPLQSGSLNNNKHDPDRFIDAENEDGLLYSSNRSKADAFADRVYEDVERHRNRGSNAARKTDIPDGDDYLQKGFSGFKRGREEVSEDQWENLPEAGDMTRRNKRLRAVDQMDRRSYAIPQSLSTSYFNGQLLNSSVEEIHPERDAVGGSSRAKGDFLSMRLDKAAYLSANSGQDGAKDEPGVNYLKELGTSNSAPDAESLVKSLRSLVQTEPKKPAGWIGLAKAEELALRPKRAKMAIVKGTQNCPEDEEVWLESIRLHSGNDAKVLAAKAVQRIPTSVRLWRAAAALESTKPGKRSVIHQAIEHNLVDDSLWIAAADLEDSRKDKQMVLQQAVALVPGSLELWVEYALNQATPGESLNVIREALQSNPDSLELLRLLGRTYENGGADFSQIRVALQEPLSKGRFIRDELLAAAQKCELEGSPQTSRALVYGLSLYLEDAELSLSKGATSMARFIFQRIEAPSEAVFVKWAEFESHNGDWVSTREVLKKGLVLHPDSTAILSTLLALAPREEILAVGQLIMECETVNDALVMKAIRLYQQLNRFELVVDVLEQRVNATEPNVTPEIHFELALSFEALGDIEKAKGACDAGLRRFGSFAQLYLLKSRLEKDTPGEAEQVLILGSSRAPHSPEIWAQLARHLERGGNSMRARHVLSRATTHNPKSGRLWFERVILEKRGGANDYEHLVSKGLQEAPSYGPLLLEKLAATPKLKRKAALVQAIKASGSNPYVLLSGGLDQWARGKTNARDWLENALRADERNADFWLYLYRYLDTLPELRSEAEALVERFVVCKPGPGIFWDEVPLNVLHDARLFGELFVSTARALDNPFI